MEIDVDEMYKKAREIGVDIDEIMDNRKQRIVPDDKIAKIKYWLKGNIKNTSTKKKRKTAIY